MRRTLMTAALAALTLVATGALAQHPAETPADRWNLAEIYPDEAAWKADADKLDTEMKRLAACKGQLASSAKRLRECLDLRADVTRRLFRIYVYASETLSSDTGVGTSLAMQQRASLQYSALQEATAFYEPEILAAGRTKIDGFLKADPALRVHAHPLQTTLRTAAHTLDATGEGLLAQLGVMAGSTQSAYGILTEADLPWPKLKLAGGEEVTLDGAGYTKYRAVANRDDRKRVMDAFFGAYKQYERTFGMLLYGQMKEDMAFAKARRYPDSISRTLDTNNVPVKVMDTLITQVQEGLPTLHRYFRLRARMLGLQQMAYYDIYPPLVKTELQFPLARGKQLALESAAPLGPDYVAATQHGFDKRWMDAYPRPRKQSGAHMDGWAYDVHPYVLMNYNEDYSSVSTLVHEWGHAMHSWLANRQQPFATAAYTTFTAEIASTFNEALLLDHVLKNAKSDDERLLYLGHALEELRGTFFRQSMFAEFERVTHAKVDRGEPMTGEDYTKTYCDLLKRYHGSAVTIDDAYCVEWAYIPHFYNNFYVYQYATSTAAAALFARQVIDGGAPARERYLDVLRAGGSQDPYELVKNAGVDLATPAPYQALTARMNRIMDEMEALLAKRGG